MKLGFLERLLCKVLAQGRVPKHIAFIMDGNRRHAKSLKKSAIEGHKLGVESMKRCLLICLELGIEIATLFAFAIENFNRSEEEVNGLMELVKRNFVELSKEQGFFQEKQIRVKVVGDHSLVRQDVRQCINSIEKSTESHNKLLVNVCFAYNSTYEIDRASSEALQAHGSETTLQDVMNHLLVTQPPDLIVRTSNEIRLSNFLTIQSMKSRIYFLKENWPQMSIWSFLRFMLPYNLESREAEDIKARVDEELKGL